MFEQAKTLLSTSLSAIEMFFRRLEIYTEVPPTTEMMDIIVQIMVEVLSILGIATKEIKQGRMSKYLHVRDMTMLTEGCSEKYVKKLIGRTDMEDALKRLDKLTQEEARMAAAENLKATHAVDERVKGVADTVVAIDNRVAGVDDRVAGVDERVQCRWVPASIRGPGDEVRVSTTRSWRSLHGMRNVNPRNDG